MVSDEAVDGPFLSRTQAPYEIWISNVDSSGYTRDPRVVEAARKMKSFFLRYRQSELRCPSLANTLAEEAVDNTCQALERDEIRRPQSYLKTAFKHAVNRYLRRERRLISADFGRDEEQLLERVVSEDYVKDLERLIQFKEVLAAMDAKTLSIFAGRRAGYTGEEIAKHLGTTTNALYTTYSRGLAHVIKTFGLSPAMVRDNQQVNGSEQQRKRQQEQPTAIPHPSHP
jgi:DNA-directed RNA polymerase specialized sigma24 family protein